MFHRVTIIGNVGQDPQMRYTPDGTAVCSFSIAATETISKQNRDGSPRPCPKGWKESYNGRNWEITAWIRATCWRGLAETVNQYVNKGRQLFVEGTLNGEASDGTLNPKVFVGSDGEHRASYEITAQTVKFLGRNGALSELDEAPPEPDGWD